MDKELTAIEKLNNLTNELSNSFNSIKGVNTNNNLRSLALIETEIVFYGEQTANGMIEIGKRLIEAQSHLGEGESFTGWLKEKFNYSRRSAYYFIKVYKEFPDVQAIARLGKTKIFQILELPEDQRQTFIEATHTVKGEEKTVEDMTTRETQEAIKAIKLAEDRAKKAEEELKTNKSDTEALQISIIEKDKEIQQLKSNPPVVEVVKEVEKAVTVEVIPSDYLTIKSRLEALTVSESKLRQEAANAKNESNAFKKSLETFKNGARSIEQISLTDFKFAVRAFMRDVSPLIYLGEQFADIKQSEREKFLEEIGLIECWISDFKQALDGKAGGTNLIILEGGYKNE